MNVERSKRDDDEAPIFSHIFPDHSSIKQWTTFLKGPNKGEGLLYGRNTGIGLFLD